MEDRMGLSVNTNVAALAATHTLAKTSAAMDTSLERLSSGYRINRAADDAAGLGISEGLRSQIGGMKQAIRNAQDGKSVVDTADGALGESTAILQRMRDLAVQAANSGVLDKAAIGAVQKEMSQLKAELDHIAATTTFNGTKLLDGSYLGTFQVGADVGDLLTIGIGHTQAGMDTRGLGVSTVDVTTSVNIPTTVVPAVSAQPGPAAAATMTLAGDYVGAGFENTFKALDGTITYNGKSFDLGSVDYTGAVTPTDYLTALGNAAAAALGTSPSAFVGTATGLNFTGDVPPSGSTDADAAALTPEYTAKSGASAAIPLIDKAVARISMARADMGAFEKRLDHTIDRLSVSITNTTASDSRIRDTDMAEEMANFSRQQVLTQAGSAMLSQANQTTQSILKLLSG
jgi:flagellin-like hook-associated protein FlgL